MPLISGGFRVSNDPQRTAIGGSSYGAVAALYALIHRPDLFGLGLLESTSLQVGNGRLLDDVSHLAIGPRRVSIGVGAAEADALLAAIPEKGLDVSTLDSGFAQLSELLAAELKASAMNRPEVRFVNEPGAAHAEKYWAERFPAAIQFLFPVEHRP
jgi:predicted alpha/beta superfamily hydrolase